MFSHPLVERYASKEMVEIFSPERKFYTWRLLWIALAEAQKELGLPITQEQIDEMKRNAGNLNLERAKELERELKHDVMAHIHAFGELCPKARPIIHLGATSCFVTDNTDIILIRDALKVVMKRLINAINELKNFCLKYKDLPCLGYTHLQTAQPTTVGKRAALWLQDFVMDFRELEHVVENLKFRGAKGTTGTQDSFMKLFGQDEEKVKRLDEMISKKFGFKESFIITGQTYTRKQDFLVASALSGIAQSAHKMGTDIRILQSFKELEEPFGKKQIGSSAMPYKRNPMKSERMCSISRFIMSLLESFPYTHATQWMERTLDDSAIRRMAIPEIFMAADSILILAANIARGLVVYPKMIEKRLKEELPFIAVEEIMMEAVKRGKDRQTLHEKIRQYAFEAAKRVKEGGENDLLQRLSEDPDFGLSKKELDELLEPKRFIGRAPSQVVEFVEKEVEPLLERYRELIGEEEEVRV
ncbi:MAG: adenylosuccinate lyase [Deferribacteres bacterium]|nr:adenylosuccinate lyase [Deferribacteres bacterium]